MGFRLAPREVAPQHTSSSAVVPRQWEAVVGKFGSSCILYGPLVFCMGAKSGFVLAGITPVLYTTWGFGPCRPETWGLLALLCPGRHET